MSQLYLIANGPMPTTAAQAVVTTGTAIKTMLQVIRVELVEAEIQPTMFLLTRKTEEMR